MSLKERPTGVEVPGVGKINGMSYIGCFPVGEWLSTAP